MRLLPPNARASGEIRFCNGDGSLDLLQLSDAAMRPLRGSQLAMIFQEPMTALNPVMRVGDQIAEAVLAHCPAEKKAAKKTPGAGRSSRWTKLASPIQNAGRGIIRTSFRAVCGSG